jgi:glutamate racemase
MRHTIGIIDSGVGGLTVVRSLVAKGAPFNVVYVGDNANMPYGNRPADEIVTLTLRMVKLLSEYRVEAVAIACNTISAVVDDVRPHCGMPLVDIIGPAAAALARRGEPDVGLFATEFTVKSGIHAKRVKELNPAVTVHGVASPRLAALIDGAIDDEAAIRDEIAAMLGRLAAMHSVKTVLLGCTHYPIAMKIFTSLAPGIEFIDPADLQADAVLRLFPQRGERTLDAESAPAPSLDLVTSGNPESYRPIMARLGIPEARSIRRLEV